MTPEQFAYWLKGFVEIQNPETLDKDQLQIIKDHLELVFDKVTPVRLPPKATPPTYPSPTLPTYPIDPMSNPGIAPSNPWGQHPTILCSSTKTSFMGDEEKLSIRPNRSKK